MIRYDFLIVGSGLFGTTFAYFAKKQGKKCLVITADDDMTVNGVPVRID